MTEKKEEKAEKGPRVEERVIVAVDQALVDREKRAEALNKKREDIRSKAKKAPDGKLLYRIRKPYYRERVHYAAGAVVAIPADELPSHTWEPVAKDDDIEKPTSPHPDAVAGTDKMIAEADKAKEAAEADKAAGKHKVGHRPNDKGI